MDDFISFFICIILITILYIHFENRNSDVIYIKSKVDNRKYLVRNLDDKQEAADLLATIRKNLVKLSQELKNKNGENIDIDRMINKE